MGVTKKAEDGGFLQLQRQPRGKRKTEDRAAGNAERSHLQAA